MFTRQGIKVGEVYELLKGDGVKLIAGKSGLWREVRSVSVAETLDSYRWAVGGEMQLTTFSKFKKIEEGINLIHELNKKGSACLAIHPGNQSKFVVPDCILEIGDRLQFPIFILPQDMPYVAIFNKVYGAILNKEGVLLRKSEEINHAMIKILIRNGSIHDIVCKLYKVLNKNVIYLNENLDLIEDMESVGVSLINFKSIILNNSVIVKKDYNEYYDDIEIKEIILKDNTIFKYVVIKLRESINNYLAIIETPLISDNERILDNIALCNAAIAIKLQKLKELFIIETEERLKYNFFDDLLNKDYVSLETMEKRAIALGLNLMFWNVVLVFDINDFEKYYRENFQKGESYIQEVKGKLKNKIEVLLEKYKRNICLFVSKSDGYIMIFGLEEKECKSFNYKRFFKEIFSKMNNEFKCSNTSLSMTIGISEPINRLDDIAKAYKQALKAIKIANKLYGKGSTVFYEDMGIYTLFPMLNSKEETGNEKLSKIREYDTKKKSNLLETLEVFLDSNGSVTKTALKIYAHPNTIKYRLKRIEEIMGEDIFKNETKRLYYHVLLKALKIIS